MYRITRYYDIYLGGLAHYVGIAWADGYDKVCKVLNIEHSDSKKWHAFVELETLDGKFRGTVPIVMLYSVKNSERGY